MFSILPVPLGRVLFRVTIVRYFWKMQNVHLIVFYWLLCDISISKISLSYRFNEFNRHPQVAGVDTELFQGGGDC